MIKTLSKSWFVHLWWCMSRHTACLVSSLHWMADPAWHKASAHFTYWRKVRFFRSSSISLNPYKCIFHAFRKFSRSTHIVLQHLASLPSWKSLVHFCSTWAGVCLQEVVALSALTSSVVCTEGCACARWSPAYNTSPAAACAEVLTTGLSGPSGLSWHHCNAPVVVHEDMNRAALCIEGSFISPAVCTSVWEYPVWKRATKATQGHKWTEPRALRQ